MIPHFLQDTIRHDRVTLEYPPPLCKLNFRTGGTVIDFRTCHMRGARPSDLDNHVANIGANEARLDGPLHL